MTKKIDPVNELSPKELAKQLKQPDGENGKQVGLHMNSANKYICLNSYKILDPEYGSHILEIGMGNGFFVKDLIGMSKILNYTGVDLSATMVHEASMINSDLTAEGTVRFKEASIDTLPFKNHSFDAITTTNTIYFWPEPEANAKELLRVLKPNGKLLIAYRSKSCMDQIELTKHGFKKYEIEDVETLLRTVGFKQVSTQTVLEPESDFEGKTIQMQGIYTYGTK